MVRVNEVRVLRGERLRLGIWHGVTAEVMDDRRSWLANDRESHLNRGELR